MTKALWSTGRSRAIALLASCAVTAAWAADDDGTASPEPAPIRTETRVERSDSADLAVRSAPGSRTGLTELSVQRWMHQGRASVGVGAGSVALVNRPNGMLAGNGMADGTGSAQASGTTLMLGLRYRTSPRSSLYADATRVQGLGLDGDERVVSKVGIEFKAAQSNWNVGYGGLGMRLAGDARMTLKLRRGGLMIGMKRAF